MLNVVSTISYRSMELSQTRRNALAAIVMVGLALTIATFASGAARAQSTDPAFAVLIFSKTAGYRHDSIPTGIAAIRALGEQNDFRVDASEDAAVFNDKSLSQYRVVVFLNTTGDILNTGEQATPGARFFGSPASSPSASA